MLTKRSFLKVLAILPICLGSGVSLASVPVERRLNGQVNDKYAQILFEDYVENLGKYWVTDEELPFVSKEHLEKLDEIKKFEAFLVENTDSFRDVIILQAWFFKEKNGFHMYWRDCDVFRDYCLKRSLGASIDKDGFLVSTQFWNKGQRLT